MPSWKKITAALTLALFFLLGPTGMTLVRAQGGHMSPGEVNRMQQQRSRQWDQDEKRIKEIQGQLESAQRFQGYEPFDPSQVGELKSDWEFFDDPRSKKK